MFNNEKPDKDVTISGNQVEANISPRVTIPDITGDSVILEANIPKDKYAIESNKNPIIEVMYVGISGT